MPQFFGPVDRDKKTGKISSEYPAWTFPRQMELMKEGIEQKERAMEMGFVDKQNEMEHRSIIERETKRLEEIESSKPKLSDAEKDTCARVQDDLAGKLQETMPTYTDMERGFVDAHYESKLNNEPCIKLGDKGAEIAHENGININSQGYINRNQANKFYKLLGHALENGKTNIERLRKDGYNRTGSTYRGR